MVYDKDTLPKDDYIGEGVIDVDYFVRTREAATEVKPEDVGTLSLRYVDGVPQLVVSGGTVLPARLTVVDASGKAVGAYTAGPLSSPG